MLMKIQQAVQRHRLFQRGDRVLVAVSGGADSVALIAALKALAPRLGITPAVAHLNHGIRGKASDQDAHFVRALAHRLKLPFVGGCCDVPRLARRKGLSVEMAAREARYDFLAQSAKRAGVDAVATAHTADDQAETVLLKLARGAGAGGLGGIPRVGAMHGVKIVRPLLDLSRKDILRFLRKKKLKWREDASNRDVTFLRNRVRHEILPLLEKKLNPAIRHVLLRTAEILSEENQWLDEHAGFVLGKCVSAADGSLAVGTLKRCHTALRRRVIRLWLALSGMPVETVDFDAVERISALMDTGKGTGTTELAGSWEVKRRYDRLVLARDTAAPAEAVRQGVKCPGETVVAGRGWRILTAIRPGLHKQKAAGPGRLPARASLRVPPRGKAFVVRSWRAGDRMRPLGLNGSKKLQDIFTDAKLAPEDRLAVPVFECGGEIVWIPGYRVAEGWGVRGAGEKAVQIVIERAEAGKMRG